MLKGWGHVWSKLLGRHHYQIGVLAPRELDSASEAPIGDESIEDPIRKLGLFRLHRSSIFPVLFLMQVPLLHLCFSDVDIFRLELRELDLADDVEERTVGRRDPLAHVDALALGAQQHVSRHRLLLALADSRRLGFFLFGNRVKGFFTDGYSCWQDLYKQKTHNITHIINIGG